jgi:hypothetical protein
MQEEVQDIYSKEFATERLNQVKDIFVSSCFTGLAYIDVKNLTVSNISMGIDGGKWIFTHCLRKQKKMPQHLFRT